MTPSPNETRHETFPDGNRNQQLSCSLCSSLQTMNTTAFATVGIHDEEAASSLSSPSLPVSSTARRFRCGAALASIILLFASAAALLCFDTSDGIVRTANGPLLDEQPLHQDQDTPDASSAADAPPLLQLEACLPRSTHWVIPSLRRVRSITPRSLLQIVW